MLTLYDLPFVSRHREIADFFPNKQARTLAALYFADSDPQPVCVRVRACRLFLFIS